MRATKAKRGFLDGYKTYDPETEGYGNPRQWREAFRATMGPEEATERVGKRSPEEILGVQPGSTWPVIVSAYRRAVMACHPDRAAIHGLAIDVAEERFKLVTAAYVILQERRHA